MSDEKESSSLLQKSNQVEQGQYSGNLPPQQQPQQMGYSGTVQPNQYPIQNYPPQNQYYQPNQYSGNMAYSSPPPMPPTTYL
jgi:transcription initiation factor TFIID subunit TAF12